MAARNEVREVGAGGHSKAGSSAEDGSPLSLSMAQFINFQWTRSPIVSRRAERSGTRSAQNMRRISTRTSGGTSFQVGIVVVEMGRGLVENE
jgi:hypothetical protein